MYKQPILKRSYTYIMPLGTYPYTAGKQVNFQYIPILEQAKIYGIQIFAIGNINTTPDNQNSVLTIGLSAITATFAEGDDLFIYNMPTTMLQPQDINQNINKGYSMMFKPRKINLPKSYVTINSGASTYFTYSVVIYWNFIYTYD